jgi:putative transposase
VIESRRSTLGFEFWSLHRFAARAAARAAVATWIEDYNHVRRHSALGMRSPRWISGLRALPGGKDAA